MNWLTQSPHQKITSHSGSVLLEVMAAAAIGIIIIGALSGLTIRTSSSRAVSDAVIECGAARLAEAIVSDLAGAFRTCKEPSTKSRNPVLIKHDSIEIYTRSSHTALLTPAPLKASKSGKQAYPTSPARLSGFPALRKYEYNRAAGSVRVITLPTWTDSSPLQTTGHDTAAQPYFDNESIFSGISAFEILDDAGNLRVTIQTGRSRREVTLQTTPNTGLMNREGPCSVNL